MANYRVQMTLKTSDGNPANYATNTWYCAATSDSAAGDFVTALVAFYSSLTSWLNGDILQIGHIFKIYDMADPMPRAPVEEGTWNLTSSPSGSNLPTEVALCLSFQADKVSGTPQARRRGRIYLGPLGTNANNDGRPATAFVSLIATSADTLYDAGVASAGAWNWAVYSTVNAGTSEVSNGWVDNEFDTQRRRGREWTSRTTFP